MSFEFDPQKFIKSQGRSQDLQSCMHDYLSGAPPSVGAERTRKFLVLQTPQMAGNGPSRVFILVPWPLANLRHLNFYVEKGHIFNLRKSGGGTCPLCPPGSAALDRTRNVVARGIADLSPQACAQLPSIDVMSRDVRRQRQTNDPPVPAPDDKLFDIPDEFRSTNDGRLFLRYDNGRDDRILLFATQRSMDFLSTCHHWFMDGTFKSSPPQFAQIYTVHRLRRGRNIPTAYALLPNRREETYVELLRQVQQLTLVAPTSVLTDFEVGAMNAIKTVYPAANVQGCFFHLCQSIHRRVQ
ncbi:hypothetical protein BSL78_26080 [Apostichopus japonicus]|uniref:MULE transposase domain-containing protein n=1 Tax=Stichopus japonicus TaxID=307972 RepID=A0A2G8JMZ9_STIJA|nr:hypothetical protein BSL78_26080 [Apostichopus japonicus]